MSDPRPIDQHNHEIRRNAESWKRKLLLQKVYREFYRLIEVELNRSLDGPTLELGSGIGAIKEHIPHCITSDLFPNPWLDRVENAYALSFGPATLANIVLFDVWHHLKYPGLALDEFARVLRPGGRVIIFDPAMGGLGRLVYGAFHPEPLGFGQTPSWFPADGATDRDTYYAAQGNCWRMFHRREFPLPSPRWRIRSVQLRSALSYVASGGFSGPQLYPVRGHGLLRTAERLLDRLPALFATRMLVVLEQEPAGANPGQPGS
jgi:SAM-dependent methyltransferase